MPFEFVFEYRPRPQGTGRGSYPRGVPLSGSDVAKVDAFFANVFRFHELPKELPIMSCLREPGGYHILAWKRPEEERALGLLMSPAEWKAGSTSLAVLISKSDPGFAEQFFTAKGATWPSALSHGRARVPLHPKAAGYLSFADASWQLIEPARRAEAGFISAWNGAAELPNVLPICPFDVTENGPIDVADIAEAVRQRSEAAIQSQMAGLDELRKQISGAEMALRQAKLEWRALADQVGNVSTGQPKRVLTRVAKTVLALLLLMTAGTAYFIYDQASVVDANKKLVDAKAEATEKAKGTAEQKAVDVEQLLQAAKAARDEAREAQMGAKSALGLSLKAQAEATKASAAAKLAETNAGLASGAASKSAEAAAIAKTDSVKAQEGAMNASAIAVNAKDEATKASAAAKLAETNAGLASGAASKSAEAAAIAKTDSVKAQEGAMNASAIAVNAKDEATKASVAAKLAETNAGLASGAASKSAEAAAIAKTDSVKAQEGAMNASAIAVNAKDEATKASVAAKLAETNAGLASGAASKSAEAAAIAKTDSVKAQEGAMNASAIAVNAKDEATKASAAAKLAETNAGLASGAASKSAEAAKADAEKIRASTGSGVEKPGNPDPTSPGSKSPAPPSHLSKPERVPEPKEQR